MLDGLKGEDSIAELCRREGIAQSLYYSWSKESSRRARSDWLETQPALRPHLRLKTCAEHPAI